MESSLASTGDSLLFCLKPHRCSCLYLLNDLVPWVDVIDNCKEAHDLGLMPRHDLELPYEVFSLGSRKERKLVDVMTIAHLVHL